jgi:hypothetical protein
MKRVPIIRHLRWLYWAWQVKQHYAMRHQLGFADIHPDPDNEQLDRIWWGEDR